MKYRVRVICSTSMVIEIPEIDKNDWTQSFQGKELETLQKAKEAARYRVGVGYDIDAHIDCLLEYKDE